MTLTVLAQQFPPLSKQGFHLHELLLTNDEQQLLLYDLHILCAVQPRHTNMRTLLFKVLRQKQITRLLDVYLNIPFSLGI